MVSVRTSSEVPVWATFYEEAVDIINISISLSIALVRKLNIINFRISKM